MSVMRNFGHRMVDLSFDLLDPRWMFEVPRRSFEGARAAVGGGTVSAATEINNKIEVFFLVLEAARKVGIRKQAEELPPLPDLVRRAYDLGPFAALWAVEGIGHEYGDTFWRRNVVPDEILAEPNSGDLPARSLLLLHSGIGLSFAQRHLEGLDRGSPKGEVRRVVGRILELCRRNSRQGFVSAAIESLGLATRTYHADLVSTVDQLLGEIGDEDVRGLFWHGAGRALYFLPVNFLPCSVGAALAMARREAPDDSARRKMYAGLAWAFTLVNQRHPKVLADLVIAPHGKELRRDDAFANGVASSIVVRAATTPGAPFLRSVVDYRPRSGIRKAWKQLMAGPARKAIEVYHPTLERDQNLDKIFGEQDIKVLVNGGGEPA